MVLLLTSQPAGVEGVQLVPGGHERVLLQLIGLIHDQQLQPDASANSEPLPKLRLDILQPILQLIERLDVLGVNVKVEIPHDAPVPCSTRAAVQNLVHVLGLFCALRRDRQFSTADSAHAEQKIRPLAGLVKRKASGENGSDLAWMGYSVALLFRCANVQDVHPGSFACS